MMASSWESAWFDWHLARLQAAAREAAEVERCRWKLECIKGLGVRGQKQNERSTKRGAWGQRTGARGARGPGIQRGARGQWPECRGVRGPGIRFRGARGQGPGEEELGNRRRKSSGKPGKKGQRTGARGAREPGIRSRGVRGQGTGPEEPGNRGLEPKARDKVPGSPVTRDSD